MTDKSTVTIGKVIKRLDQERRQTLSLLAQELGTTDEEAALQLLQSGIEEINQERLKRKHSIN